MKKEIKKTIAKLSTVALMFAMVVSVAPQSDAATDNIRTVDINAEVLSSLQLVVDADTVNITVDPDVNGGSNMSGGVVSDSTTTTVNTNNFAGYKLAIALAGAETKTGAVLDGSGTTASIATGDFASENTFSFALNNAAATGSTTLFTYANADITGSGLGQSTNSNQETISYYLNVDYTTPADVYKGTVTYTAIAL